VGEVYPQQRAVEGSCDDSHEASAPTEAGEGTEQLSDFDFQEGRSTDLVVFISLASLQQKKIIIALCW
jgi:hypothetical protein